MPKNFETQLQAPPAQLDGMGPLVPPEAAPPELHANPDPAPVLDGLAMRFARWLGIDRAIAFTVMARGWSSLAGIGTLTLIAHALTPAEQGFYYTFYSLVAMQIIFELGFSVVILQTASHEAAHLTIASDGTITGPAAEHGRLASVLQKSVRWYTVAAVLMGAVLLPTGIHFFRANAGHASTQAVHWMIPWCLVVLASCWTFQIDPLFSFMEGCGYVPQVARTRLTQAITGTVLGWMALLLHHGLLAPGLMIAGQALAGSRFVWTKRGLLLPLLRHSTRRFRVDWSSEVWPFQWRIAISWVCGYFIVQLFTPILFKVGGKQGAIQAGQMGMTMNICGVLSSMAVSWMNTKAAPFGRMIALRDFQRLDRTFFRALLQSALAAVIAFTAVWITTFYLRRHDVMIAKRLLPPVPLAMMFLATIGNIIVFAEALYLRAHKQEKFMINSILGALYTAPIAFLVGRDPGPHGGAWGIAFIYMIGTLIIGLGYGTYTFFKWRSIWHA
jgi:O-antigen/teichoic acid export membrane protein